MSIIACGTGSRPAGTPAKYERFHPWKLGKIQQLTKYLENNNFTTIISGGAEGWDQWLAWTALKVGVPLVFYLPFEGFDSKWSIQSRNQLSNFLSKAQHYEYVCEPGYAAWKMHKRNESMIRDSNIVLALWNPEKLSGGTFTTVQYAIENNKPIVNFW